MKKDAKIFIAGHRGLVGSALVRQLRDQGYTNLICEPRSSLELCDQKQVNDYFSIHKPEYVFLAAAKVGGIHYNKTFPADFIRENLLLQTNVIDAAYRNGCKKLLFIGSACIYPKNAPIPIREDHFLQGPVEETNEAYALAKIAGYFTCKKYTEQFGMKTVSVMPNNIYGTNDNFNPSECHVIPSFINRFLDAREKKLEHVVCFGDGSPVREFLYSDDLAECLVFLMREHDNPDIINVGPDREVSIKELAHLIAKAVGYEGDILWDTSKPNGTMRRVLDTSKIKALGWTAKTSLEDGITKTVDWFLANRGSYVRL